MTQVIFDAKRSMLPGRTEGDEVTLDMPLTRYNPDGEQKKTDATSIGGNSFTTLEAIRYRWSCATVDIHFDDKPKYQEFFDSVAAGEEFDIDDPFGDTMTVKLLGSPRWSQTNSVGYYTASFKILKLRE